MSCLKSIKQGQSTPPPEKTKQYIVLLACNHTKNLRYKNAKGSTRSMSPDAKRSTGVIVPPPMQQERHAGRDPSQAGGEALGQFRRPIQQESRTRAALIRFPRLFLGQTLAHTRRFRPSRKTHAERQRLGGALALGKRGAQSVEQGNREMLGAAALTRVFPHTTGKLDGDTARRRLASCSRCFPRSGSPVA